ncbi:MAG: hypothetical protein RIT37_1629 [Bacteroidota bacterium]
MKVKQVSLLNILRITLPLWALSLIISMSGCNEQSPIAGGAIFDDTINVNVISSDSIPMFIGTNASSLKPSASYAADLFLGSARGYTSSILARFGNVPDSLPDAEIISATLILQPKRYALGDSLSNRIALDVFSINKPWTPRATIDSFLQAGFLDVNAMGTFDGSIALRDTMPEITITIAQSLIKSWFILRNKAKNDSTINTESAYGLALTPKSGSSVIRAFARNTISTPDNPPVRIRVAFKKTGSSTIDTMVLESAYDATFTTEPNITSDKIVLNYGTGTFSNLDISLKDLPTGIAIHGAVLTLMLDSIETIRGNQFRDSVISSQFIDSLAGNLVREFTGFSKSGSVNYEFPIVNGMVESLLRNTKTGSLKILPYILRDRTRLDRMVFFGPKDPDPKKRPSLRIIYSTRPKP